MPAAAGMRMLSVAMGGTLGLALTEEGQVYRWGATNQTDHAPPTPILFEEMSELKVRRVAAGACHSAAITDKGKLYTWWENEHVLESERGSAVGAGYPLPELSDSKAALYRPRWVDALAGMRIVSVAAGMRCTIVATDGGAAWQQGASWVAAALRPCPRSRPTQHSIQTLPSPPQAASSSSGAGITISSGRQHRAAAAPKGG